MTKIKCCPTCGHPLPQDIAPGLHLTPILEKILHTISRHSPHGIWSSNLIHEVYNDREDGGPDNATVTLRTHVWRLNQQLKKQGIRIDGRGGGGYRLIRAK